jgi:hypothetical protein
MSVFGRCPIWVLKRSGDYLADEAGWVLAFTTPGKALAFVRERAGWQSHGIAPDQMLLLIADLHELNTPGVRLNPAPNSAVVGHRYPLDALVASHLQQRTVA